MQPAAFCANCGTARVPGMRFCPACGHDHQSASDVRAPIAQGPAAAGSRPAGPPVERWTTGAVLLATAAVLLAVAIFGLIYSGIAFGPSNPEAGLAPGARGSQSEQATPTAVAATPSPLPTPTQQPVVTPPPSGIAVDLTFTGPHAFAVKDELLSVIDSCAYSPVPSDPSRSFVERVSVSLPLTGGATADLLYNDADGPGDGFGLASLAVPNGFSTAIYRWSAQGNQLYFGSPQGSVAYANDLRTMTFDLMLRTDLSGEASRLTGTVVCPPNSEQGKAPVAVDAANRVRMDGHYVTVAEGKEWIGVG
jgi:hypothetical protein